MVKKFLLILLTLILLVSCVGCHQDPPPAIPNVLVVYFSATGTTRRVAEEVARVLNCDIFEIQPEQPYTKEHLDWTNKNSRTSVEATTDDCRPAVATKPDVKPYDVIFVGFPIWWYTAPKIINTFLEQYDLTGKTVVPFATSGGVLPSDRQTKNCNLPAMVQNYCPARYSVVLQAKENWKIGLKTHWGGKKMEKFNPLFGLGESNTAFQQYFTGESFLKALNTKGVGVYNVSFRPGCRNNWHIHHKGGQILLCTDGEGWYQEKGMPARRLLPGDVVYIAPEVKHWHGAAKDKWFCHIAVEIPAENSSNEWCEEVTDIEYNSLEGEKMSFSTLCHERFSARKYIDKKVEEEKIAAILEAGRVAPTAKNNQPQRIYLLKSDEALQKIRGITPCTFGAPSESNPNRWVALFLFLQNLLGCQV